MSLAIEVDEVAGVLLADGWHVVDDDSFDLDSYEFLHGEVPLHLGGQSGICATGFAFKEGGDVVLGPLTSILAVRCRVLAT